MLDTIRRHQKSWLTYVIFLAIIVVFAVNFGPGSSSCGSLGGTSYAAMVDGDYIPQQDFAMAYSQQLEQMRRRARASQFDFTEKMAEQMGLRQQVIEGLITEKLLAREATRRGLRVSDAELLEYLHKAYKVNDVSVDDYRAFVERNFRMTVQRFEDERRQELLAQKLASFLQDETTVSERDLRDDYMRDHDRAMIEYVKFDVTGIKLVEPSKADIDKLIAAEPQAIDARYQADAAHYRTAEERQAREIVLKLSKDATDADVARLRSQLSTFKDQIASGADFVALCKEHSQDEVSKAKGGDLGWHKRGELAPAIDRAVFALKVNEMTSEPLRADDGLHLVQLVAIKPSEPKPQDEVKNEVAASILRERVADAQLAAAATNLLTELKAGKKLEALTISESDAKKPKDEPKAAPPAAKDAGKGKAVAAKTAPPPAVAEDRPLRYESAWITKTQEGLPRIGVAPELQQAIFALTKEAPVAPQIYKVGRTYYVVVLKEREIPDLAKFESDKASLREQALWSKRSRVFQEWMQHLRQQAEVELNPSLFASQRPGQNDGEG